MREQSIRPLSLSLQTGSDYVQSPQFPCSPSTSGNTIAGAPLQDYYIKPVPLPEYGVSSDLTVSSMTIEYQGTKTLHTNYLRMMGVNLIVYQIYYNKENITDYIHVTDEYIVDYTFTLTRLSFDNAGFYSIVVTFCSDTASKQVQATVELQLSCESLHLLPDCLLYLVILARINKIIAEPYSVAMDNSIARLYCFISGYIPPYSDVIWSKDHHALTNTLSRRVFFDVIPDINSVGQNGGSQTGPGVIVVMNIMSPTAGDVGTYGCQILGTSISRYVDVYDIINPLPTKGRKNCCCNSQSEQSHFNFKIYHACSGFFIPFSLFKRKKIARVFNQCDLVCTLEFEK